MPFSSDHSPARQTATLERGHPGPSHRLRPLPLLPRLLEPSPELSVRIPGPSKRRPAGAAVAKPQAIADALAPRPRSSAARPRLEFHSQGAAKPGPTLAHLGAQRSRTELEEPSTGTPGALPALLQGGDIWAASGAAREQNYLSRTFQVTPLSLQNSFGRTCCQQIQPSDTGLSHAATGRVKLAPPWGHPGPAAAPLLAACTDAS